MARIENGRQMLLPEALLLQNPDNEDIKWEKSEDGTSYTSSFEVKPTTDASGKKLDGYKYTYRIDVLPQIANVTVSEVVIDAEPKKKGGEEDERPKTVEEATASLAQGTGIAETAKTTTAESSNKTYHKK
jgi:hypothetical protein